MTNEQATGAESSAPRAPEGWYPDPSGGDNQAFWDGSKWTGETRRPAPPRRPEQAQSGDWSRRLLIGGGIALAVSPFLPWVKVILLGDLSLFQLYSAAGRSRFWPWAAVFAGGLVAAAALDNRRREATRHAAMLVGALGGVMAVYALVGLRHDIREADGFAAIGVGPYVAIAGCVAIVVGGFLARPNVRSRLPKP